MKKLLAILIVLTLVFSMSACGEDSKDNTTQPSSEGGSHGLLTQSKEPTTEPTTEPESKTEPTTAPSDKDAGGHGTSSVGDPADYVSTETIKTDFGVILKPVIDLDKLPGKAAEDANKLFDEIAEQIQGAIAERDKLAAENGDFRQKSPDDKICEYIASVNDGVLSILVSFTHIEYYVPDTTHYISVNIYLKTGKNLSLNELLALAGYEDYDIDNTLFYYNRKHLGILLQRMQYFSLAESGEMPEAPQWVSQDLLDSIDQDVINAFYDNPEEQYEDLGLFIYHPCVYYGGYHNLSVCGRVITMAGAGFSNTMMRVGRSYAEIDYYNPYSPYGLEFERYAMNPEVAIDMVKLMENLDFMGVSEEGVQYQVEADRLETYDFSGMDPEAEDYVPDYEPIYVVRVFENLEDHIVTKSWWGVGVFSGRMLYMDIVNGEWQTVYNEMDGLADYLVEDGLDEGAAAIFWYEIGFYYGWAMDIDGFFDFTEYYTPEGHEVDDFGMYLVVMKDDTTVHFVSGFMDGDEFVVESEMYTEYMNSGQAINVWAERPESDEEIQFAIIIENEDGEFVYPIDSIEPEDRFEYITPEGIY